MTSEGLEQRRGFQPRHGLLLRFGATETEKGLLGLERWLSGLNVGGEQFLQLVELPALFLDAGLGGLGLLACGFASGAGLKGAADELRAAND